MSRLYAWLFSDMAKHEVTRRGNNLIHFRINYGNKKDSQKLISIGIAWMNDKGEPEVDITTYNKVKVRVHEH